MQTRADQTLWLCFEGLTLRILDTYTHIYSSIPFWNWPLSGCHRNGRWSKRNSQLATRFNSTRLGLFACLLALALPLPLAFFSISQKRTNERRNFKRNWIANVPAWPQQCQVFSASSLFAVLVGAHLEQAPLPPRPLPNGSSWHIKF